MIFLLPRLYFFIQKRKTDNKPRDSSTPSGNTAIESVQSMVKKSSKYSRRINYEALENLFANDAVVSHGALAQQDINLDDKEDDMYILDEKSDGEGMNVVVEESGGGVGVGTSGQDSHRDDKASKSLPSGSEHADEEDGEADAEGEELELSEKGDDDYGWDEGYEQEV